MVEAKGTKSAADKTKAAAASKFVQSLAAKKKARRKDNRPLFYGAALVFAVVLTVVILSTLKKKPVTNLVKDARTAGQAVTRKARRAASDSTAAPRSRHPVAVMPAAPARSTPRDRGLRQRQPVASRPSGARTSKAATDRASRSRGQSSRQSPGSDIVTAIGEGSAMVGSRQVHAGDVIRGRIIQEIGADAIKVEYVGTVFTVRIGDALP
jgi:hypothetical protein